MTRIPLVCFTLILFGVACCAPDVFAAGWLTTPGIVISAADKSIYIPEHQTSPDVKTSEHVVLQDGKPWSITFDVKLGSIVGSMSVSLLKGDDRIGWMGADDYYKAESAFLGKDMPSSRPMDKAWHKYEYRSDGQTLALYCDDQKVDETSSSVAPDAIQVSSTKLEVALRNVTITTHPLLNPALAEGSNLFVEYFDDPSSFSAKWSEADNTGNVAFTTNGISLRSSRNGLPSIQSKSNPFTSSDWTVSFGYRYSSIGGYGTDLACMGKDGAKIFCVHQDRNGQLIQINSKNIHEETANTNWHVLSVTKSGHDLIAYLDGRQVGHDTIIAIPTTVTIGGSYQSNPWDWNSIDVQFVRVNNGRRIYDKTALNIAPSPVLSINPAPNIVVGVDPLNKFDDGKDLKYNTENALFKSQVDAKIIDAEDDTLIVDAQGNGEHISVQLSVTNRSDKNIEFWTTPIIMFADGTISPSPRMSASKSPIINISVSPQQAISMALGSSSRGRINTGNQNYFIPTSMEDTMIPPGRTLYFRCGAYIAISYPNLARLYFRGGGYDRYLSNMEKPVSTKCLNAHKK